MECLFCGLDENVDDITFLCNVCSIALNKDQTPPIDFKRFFSSGLETKLSKIDTMIAAIPDNFFLWYLKGHLEHDLGESKRSLRSINTSISYKEDFGDSWIRLGLIYSDLHKENEAKTNFQRGLRHPLFDPSNLIDAGAVLQASDQPELAARILQRALDLVPDDDRGMLTLSKVLIKTGKLKESRKIMERAVELYPHNEEILRGMAQIMMGLENLDSAMDMYSRILDQHPRDFEALLGKAEVYLRTGQLTLALKSYQAVRDLDIQISWGGILRFIVSSMGNFINRNKNQPSYREDLKKEYRNIKLFLEELDEKVQTSKGPEMLDELKSLMKVIETMKISMKEQIGQYEELLEKYMVDDSFHQHLEKKVSSLKKYHSDMRFFDGKQISLELSPFLSDLGKMDSKTENRLRKEIEDRFEELEEIGLMNEKLFSKMGKVEKLEKEGNIEGASFLLKEIQISLDEYWQDEGRKYFKNKKDEMEELLNKGKDQFDTSGLRRKLKDFNKAFKNGPIAIRDSYLEFTRIYAKDSQNYFQKEVERTLREIQYKIVILEKDGKTAKVPNKKLKKLKKMFDAGERPIELHQEAMELLSEMSEIELKQKMAFIRERLVDLDKLLGDIDALGMDEEIARNVEPVRRVIERSLKNENYRLSDILTGEVYDNVEKLLKDNYINGLKKNMYDSMEEIDRLRNLGVEEKEWDFLLKMSQDVLDEDEITTPLIPVVNCLAELQTLIQNFYVERLTGEIDSRIERLKGFIKEGLDFGFDLEWYENSIKELEKRSEEISSLEILEESVSLESELEVKINTLLADCVRSRNSQLKKDMDKLTENGATPKELMVILSLSNKAEMLLEVGGEKESYAKIMEARSKLETLDAKIKDRMISILVKDMDEMFASAKLIGMDMKEFRKEYNSIMKKKSLDRSMRVTSLEKLRERSWEDFDQRIIYIYEELEVSVGDIISQSQDLLPDTDIEILTDNITKLKVSIDSHDMESIPEQISQTEKIVETYSKKTVELILLSQCSIMIEEGLSLSDEKARTIVKEIQEIAGNIKEGDLEQSEIQIKKLKRDLEGVKSLHQMEDIETMLIEINELDELSKNLFEEIKDKDLKRSRKSIQKNIRELIDSTSLLYDKPEEEAIDRMKVSLQSTKDELIDLENKWRAFKRIRSLEEMGVYNIQIKNKLIQKDIDNLKKSYDKDDILNFFRVWERVEGKLDIIKRQMVMEKTTHDGGEGMDVLVRGNVKKKRDGSGTPDRSGGLFGIQKLAQDMGEKRKKLDRKGSRDDSPPAGLSEMFKEGPVSDDDDEDVKHDLTGIAKMIAGERIKKLEKRDLTGTEVKDTKIADLPWSKDMDLDLKSLSSIIEDINSIERDEKVGDAPITEAERIRDRLDGFYNQLPENLSLDESFSKYEKGVEHLNDKDYNSALREFRLAISSAIKMAKLHTEITKAITSIDKELSTRRKRGEIDHRAERLFMKAEGSLKNGDLADCATLIKAMKKVLFN